MPPVVRHLCQFDLRAHSLSRTHLCMLWVMRHRVAGLRGNKVISTSPPPLLSTLARFFCCIVFFFIYFIFYLRTDLIWPLNVKSNLIHIKQICKITTCHRNLQKCETFSVFKNPCSQNEENKSFSLTFKVSQRQEKEKEKMTQSGTEQREIRRQHYFFAGKQRAKVSIEMLLRCFYCSMLGGFSE